MKLSKRQLKQIIKEERQKLLNEYGYEDRGGSARDQLRGTAWHKLQDLMESLNRSEAHKRSGSDEVMFQIWHILCDYYEID